MERALFPTDAPPVQGAPPRRPPPWGIVPAPPPDAADAVEIVRVTLPPGAGAVSRCPPGPMPFEWTLNPYRGCAFACGYCYARYTHGYLGMDDPRSFEKRVFVKDGLPRAFAHDLDTRIRPGQRVALGTATDPYQPAERTAAVTRGCLQVMARRAAAGRALPRLSITTKSDLVLRDLDLLRVLAERGALHVNLTLTTLDRRLAKELEPAAPPPERRLRALRTLAAEGIPAGVFAMPVLPGLTDGPGEIEALAAAARDAGAGWLTASCLFLREPTRSFWMGLLRRRWPALVPRYERWFRDGAHADPALKRHLERRIVRARRRYGLASAPVSAKEPPGPQLTLPFA